MFIQKSKQHILSILLTIFLVLSLVGCNKPSTETSSPTSEVSVHFIDTGNSDSILIKDGTTSLLIDGGDNDDGDTVTQYLKEQGITQLTYLLATHPHADHIGGLDTVIDSIPVETLYVSNGSATSSTYRDFICAAMNRNLQPSVPLEDNKFSLENSYFQVFNTNGGKDANDQSLVVLFTHGKDQFLFMGDAESSTEKEILPKMVDVDVLKVGHHGSSSSTTPTFFNKVKPEYAILMVGAGNKYGHPHKETVTLLKEHHTKVHRSDECGNIVFYSSGKGVHTDCPLADYLTGNEDLKTSTPSSNKADSLVYWTPKGKSYHTTKKCSGLVKSKTILSGSIKESGKNDPCDRCH